MNKEDFQEIYERWWLGKKCRLLHRDNEFKRVKEIELHGPPSFVYGVVELIFEDGTHCYPGSHAFKARKKDVEVLGEK